MLGMGEITTIHLTKETRDMLKQYGVDGENYDVILRRVMAGYRGYEQIKRGLLSKYPPRSA